jgi:hypothetical protein
MAFDQDEHDKLVDKRRTESRARMRELKDRQVQTAIAMKGVTDDANWNRLVDLLAEQIDKVGEQERGLWGQVRERGNILPVQIMGWRQLALIAQERRETLEWVLELPKRLIARGDAAVKEIREEAMGLEVEDRAP